ncbi:MAG: hypothetical protein LUE29_01860 [Lachnospiraceae bacterium]|nr:hypothetical protein [Lachnospiraceae bacterium]
MIEKHIRKLALRHMIFPVLMLAAIGALFHFLPFSEVFHPETIESLSSISFQYSEDEPYVTLTCDYLRYTGYDHYVSGNKAGSYYYTFLDDTCYFVLIRTANYNLWCVPGEQTVVLSYTLTDQTVSGKVLKTSHIPSDLFTQMADDLGWTTEGLTEVCSSYYISECTFDVTIYTYLRWGLSILAVFFALALIVYIFWLLRPSFYTGTLCLLRYGPVRRQFRKANAELAGDIVVRLGNVCLTPDFYVEFGQNRLIVMPLKRILWVYRIGAVQRFLFFRLPVSYRIYLHGRGHVSLTSEQMDADTSISITRYLKTNVPDLLVGYTDSNRRLAKDIDAGRKKKRHNSHSNQKTG